MTDFEFMIKVWGYAVSGRSDLTVAVSEARSAAPDYWLLDPNWDRKADYLTTVRVKGGTAPEKFALWWVCEHLRRHEGEIRDD